MRTSQTRFKTVAAVDLGSNSFHMIIARLVEGGLHTLDRMREMVRLAGGLDEHGNLDDVSIDRALTCLKRFGQRLHGMPLGSVRAVGTNTLRRARNVHSFLRQAHEALGHPIEVIAGREEARLIYLGVSHSIPDMPGNRLVIDIGGGSTEFIIGEGFEPKHRESLVMGCVSYSMRFFPNGEIKLNTMLAAETAAAQELQIIRAIYPLIGWHNAIGSSGTINAIHEILTNNHLTTSGITMQGLYALREALLSAGNTAALNLIGLQPQRSPVLPGGLAILIAAFENLGIEKMMVSDGALREGLLYDLLGRLVDEDVRDRTTRGLMRRYHVDLSQARRVEHTALSFFNQLSNEFFNHPIPINEHRNMLSWAALLHELGLTIEHSGYHRHGAYLVANSDMPGFSRSEQQFIGALIRGHRRRFPADLFSELPSEYFDRAWILCVILRISIILHHSRSHSVLPEIRISFKLQKKSFKLKFPNNWLDRNPLTKADLEQEINYLKAAEIKLSY